MSIFKAIQAFFDPVIYTKKVVGNPGNKPTYSYFPGMLKGAERNLIQEYPPKKVLPNIEKAKAYIAKAKTELGVEKIPH